MEVPPKMKNRTKYDPTTQYLSLKNICFKENKILFWKHIFIAVLRKMTFFNEYVC